MDTYSSKQTGKSTWADRIQAQRESDQRQQPWKKALEVEKRAKDDGTYGLLEDFIAKDPRPDPPAPTH